MQISIRESKSYSKLIAWVKLLETVNDEMTLVFSSDGISSRTMDNSHVEMLECTIPASLFDEYKVDESDEQITFSITELRKVLDQFDIKKENVTIMHDSEKAKLVLKANRGSGQRVRQFSVNLLEQINDDTPEPKIIFKSKVQLIIEDLREALTAAAMYTENVIFIINELKNPKLRIEGKGDLGNYWDEITPISASCDESSTATFTLSYIMELVKALKPLAEKVTINMTTDMPLQIDVELEAGKLQLWLAPCISN